jgi:hypothetical protein
MSPGYLITLAHDKPRCRELPPLFLGFTTLLAWHCLALPSAARVVFSRTSVAFFSTAPAKSGKLNLCRRSRNVASAYNLIRAAAKRN